MLKCMRAHWKRAVSGLLAVIMAAGMLPVSAFAADTSDNSNLYAPTGSFELNVAGATAWNGGDKPFTVYKTEGGNVPVATLPTATPFALLEDNSGDRIKIGYQNGGWTGANLDGIGWVDKDSVLVNLPDVIPSIAYESDGSRLFNSRLTRFEYVIPGSYALAEQLAHLQKESMAGVETLVVRQSGQMVSVSRAKGDPAQLHSYTLDGVTYQKYEAWAEYETAGDSLSNLSYDLPFSVDQAYSADPSVTLTRFCPQTVKHAPSKVSASDPTGGVGAYNPGSPGGKKPTTSNVDWRTDAERTFLRFTLIEFPNGVVTDLNTNDYSTWHVVGTPLNIVWNRNGSDVWSADKCRSDITWYNSCAMQYNGKGADAAQLMAGSSVPQGVYSYDATAGHNKRWVTTADEFQKETGITDQQKEQMFHCNSSSWSSGWRDGDYTSMWGTDAESVTPGNLYKVYKANDAFLYLLGRLSETDNGAGGDVTGWSKDEAMERWSEYVHDADGNLRTKYRVIVETGGVFRDPDGVRRAYTLREMMAYTIYNNESQVKGNLIWDQASTMVNMARWMRQGKDQQFLEYPLNEDGTPTGEELHSTNGFRECDSYVDTIQYPRPIRDTIFNERRSFGLHIFSPFNFERKDQTELSLEVTKKTGAGIALGQVWNFTVRYTAGRPSSFTATKNGTSYTNQVVATDNGLKFTLTGDETIHIDFEADPSFRFEVTEDDSSQLTNITGTGGTADMSTKKFTSSGGASKVTFTNGTAEKKPVYLKLKKIAAADKRPLAGAEFSVYADSSCSGTPLAVMTTGADGTASTSVPNIVEDGKSVTLYVKETKAPAGCTPLASPFTVTCKAPENSTAAGAVQVGPASGIENGGIPEPGKALLFKRDALTNTGVGPATFKFSSVTNGVYEFDTDEAGVLESVQWWDPTEASGKYIKPGEYAVTELVPPPNYEPTTEVQQIKLELDANGNPIPAGPLVFKNLAKVGLKIVKYDRQSHRPMANVTFEIFRDGVSLGHYETNASGEILLTGIEPGTYRAVEVDTGDDSHIKDTAPQEIELTAGCGTKELFFFNDTKPGMKLVKVDSADPSKTIPGVKFSIRAIDGSYGPQEFVTDGNGEIDLSNLPAGSYEVTELECPGYVVDNAQRIIHLRANDTAEFVFTNTKKPGLRLIKTSADGSALDGVTFKITPIGDASHSIDRTTQNGGEILVEGLEPGIYSVVETATLPDHILDTTEYHVELSPGKTAELRLSNDKRPSLIISKTDKDTGDPVPGVTFTLRGADGPTITTKPTGSDGKIVTTDLLPGVYTVTEQSVPENYILDTTPQTVTLFPNKEAQVEFQNYQRPTLKIVKVDIAGKHLTGAIFEVKTKAGVKIGDFPVGADGTITVPQKHLTEGYYIITEKQAPAGYILDPTPHEVYLRPGKTTEVSIENEKKPGLTIYKVDSIVGDGIKGAKFEIWVSKDKNQNGTYQQLTNSYYYSDENGIIHLDNLDTGWYKIVEVEPPAGFMLKEPSEQTIYIEHDTSVEVTFENIPKSALVIRKIDSDTGAPLANAWFRVRYLGGTSGSGGTIIGEYATSSNGNIVITGLDAGTYVVEEISAPHGYVMDTAPQTAYISGKEQDCITLTFTNSKYGSLLVKKVDSITGEPLSDIQFFITTSDGAVVGNGNGYFTTDSAGTILVSDIMPGTTLVVKETRTKPGYILDDVPQTVKIESNETKTLEFRNQPTGSLLIRKVCSVNPSVTLANAEFKVAYSDGSLIGDSNGVYRSDENGEVRIEGLTPGKSVIITETKAPAGFLIDTQSQTVVIQAGKTVSVTMKNQPKGQLIVQKRDSATNKPLPGAEFRITTAAGCEVGLDGVIGTSTLTSNGIFTTDSLGEIRITNLAPGAYVLSEIKAPDGYIMDSPSTNVVIGPNGDTQTIIITNTPKATLTITKRDAVTRKPLANAEFIVRDSEGHAVGPTNGIYKTGTDGTVIVSGLEPGSTIMVSETRAPTGYILDETPKSIVVKSGISNSLIFDNQPGTTLIIRKFIEGTENEPLSGVCFKVVDGSGAAVGPDDGVYFTDKAGEIVLEGIEPGTTVIAREIKTVEGFVLDGTPQDILIKGGEVQQLTFWNKRAGTLVIQKKDSVTGNFIPGAQFQLTYANGGYVDADNGHLSSNGLYTTDDKGEIRISGIVGTVVAKEVKAAPGYVIDQSTQTQTVTVNPMDTQTLTFLNEPLCSLTITKKDSVTGKPVPGTEFTVKDGNGTVLGRYTTGKDGTVVVTGLIPGSTVVVVETKVPSGYVLNSTPQIIIVKNGSNSVSSGGTTGGTANPGGNTSTGGGTNGGNDITFENDPKTTLVIEKYITGTTTPLKGVTFLVTESNGKVLGANNGEYTTDENGRIVIEGLEPGVTIIAKEIRGLHGYVLDTSPKTIQIKVGDAQTLKFYNTPVGGLELIKVSEADKTQRIKGVTFEIRKMDGALVDTVTTGDRGRVHVSLDAGDYYCVEVEAAEGFKIDSTPHYFTIRDNETTTLTVTNAPFSGIILHKIDSVTGLGIYGVKFLVYDQNKNPIGEYSTDDSGYIYIDDLTIQGKGKLFIRELEAAPGYELDKEYKTVYVQPGKTVEIEWENTPITGQIQVQKYAAEYNEVTGTPAGAPLQGAVYEISEARSGKVVDYITTDARGVAASKPLPLGRYKIVEVTAPAYWQVSGKTFDETLEYSGQIIKVSDYDKPSNLGVTITKRGNAEVLAGSQMRYDFTVANTSNVPLESYYWHDRIPTDAARATIFTTGTYSARLNYRILYKTNYSGAYQVLASNLITSINYSFSLNAIPMQAGEYVTDVYLDFGKVPVGFQSVANPTLTVTVSGTAANGYQLINRADVGGKYQGAWQTAQATWLTVIRKLTPTYVPTLPKTGY